jgi:hypothetical protein
MPRGGTHGWSLCISSLARYLLLQQRLCLPVAERRSSPWTGRADTSSLASGIGPSPIHGLAVTARALLHHTLDRLSLRCSRGWTSWLDVA